MRHKLLSGLPAILFALVLVSPARSPAQEISVLAGGMSTVTTNRLNTVVNDGNQTSYAWQLDFRHPLGKHFAWSASWINEGHTDVHHRDGFATQLWGDLLSFNRFDLAVGFGEYRFFDTQLLPSGDTTNVHGWTPIASASLTYYTASPVFFRLTANQISRSHGLGTNSLLLGVGYELSKATDPTYKFVPRGFWERSETPSELTAFTGKSIVNTGESQHAVASGLEFRKGLAQNFDWTVSWINEGDPRIIRRNGFAAQLWAVDEFSSGRLSLGFGAGGYWFFDRRRAPVRGHDPRSQIAGLVSPTIAWRMSPHWQTRLTWNRVISDYNRDADVILLGLGYRWGLRQ